MRCPRLAVSVTCGLFGPAALAQAPSWTIVARSGQIAPGTSASYDRLTTPALNQAGQVAFGSTLAGPGATSFNNTAVFAGLPASPSLLVRSGAPAPGGEAGVTFAAVDFVEPRFNADGHAIFGAPLAGPGIDPNNNFATYGYWLAAPGAVRQVAPAVGPANTRRAPLLTAGDRAAWLGDDGVFYSSAANPNPAPFGANPIENFVLNPAGAIAYLSSVETGGLGVQVGPPGDIREVAKSGDPAPGLPAGTTFSLPLFPAVNAAGHVAFQAYLGPSTGARSESTVWAGPPGALGLVARGGQVAPGTGGLRYGDFGGDIDSYRTPGLSPTGEVAFAAVLMDDQQAFHDTGLFAGRPGQVRLVALEGQHAPNAPDDVTVGELNGGDRLSINALGQVAFADNVGNLYVADANGALTLIAAVDQPFELAPGDVRTVNEIGFGEYGVATGGQDGHPYGFNDAGQLAFSLGFTDRTSAVVFATVPEPSSVGAGVVLGGAWAGRRSRRR